MRPALPPDYETALSAYAARVASRFGERLVLLRLFGSWARGEAHEDSDIDVAVVVDQLSRAERDAAISDAVDVELETEVSLSPYVISAERFEQLQRRQRRIAMDVLNEGVPL